MTSYIILKFWPNLGLYVTLVDLFSSPKFSAIAKSCEFLVVMNYDRISKTLSLVIVQLILLTRLHYIIINVKGILERENTSLRSCGGNCSYMNRICSFTVAMVGMFGGSLYD